ncbi:type II toxin-antitoxin system Phd/YefM family antitoxin [Laspinema palackyanum]|uniref:type II toxin-antitoxin system Phd/YefM family antitoxin n=1 Tax=Laspinema palackyanum TaxID=3231601 RepID=UPI00345D2DE0|nr:hypothetical protein [Laspinema sp. D2c]
MVRVTIEEIQRDPLEYLRRVEEGETLVIVRSQEAIAQISTHSPSSASPTPSDPFLEGFYDGSPELGSGSDCQLFP